MKTIFLISDFPHGLTEDFQKEFVQCVSKKERFCYVSSSFSKHESNKKYANRIFEMFQSAGFNYDKWVLIDDRMSVKEVKTQIEKADAVFLAGGDTLLQIQSLKEYGIDQILQNSNAVIMGLSAGAINLAKTVVLAKDESDNIPELSVYSGLGLVDINIEPHLDLTRQQHLQEIMEAAKHSEIIGLYDNSFIRVNGNDYEIFGPYRRFKA